MLLPLSVSRSGSIADIGLVMGAFNLGGLSAPLWGGIADRHGLHRFLLITGLLVVALALGTFPFATSTLAQLVLALAQGVGAASAATVANIFIVEMHPRVEWDERIGWLQTFFGGGQVAGLLLAGVVSVLDLHAGFFLAAGITLLACPVALFMKGEPGMRSGPRRIVRQPSRHAELNAGSPQSYYHHLNAGALTHLIRSLFSPLGYFLIAWFISFAGVAAYFSLYPVLMKKLYGVDPSLSSIGFAVAATVGLFLYAPAGTWSGKFGPLRIFRAALAARGLAFIGLIGIGCTGISPGGPLSLGGFAFVVLAWSLLSVTGTEITARFSEEHEGEGLGLFNACTAVSGVLGAVVGGWSAGVWGYHAVAFLGLAGIVAGLLLTALVRTQFAKPEEKER
jgi:DHA1 family tetracycline resistance protein-like MFS transporter